MEAAGLNDCKVSVLARPAEVWARLGGPAKLRAAVKYTLIGALLGVVVASLYALPATILNCAYMGCAFSAHTLLLVAIYLYWIAAGGFMGTLIGMDRLERDTYSYVEGVRHGGSLVIVEAPDEEAGEVTSILVHEGGLLVHNLESGQEEPST